MIETIYKELKQYPKRLTRKQKQDFLDYSNKKLSQFGYSTQISTGRYILKSKNLETLNDAPDLIIGAHYDTPTILPFFFEYLFKLFGHTRQIIMLFAIILAVTFFSFAVATFHQYPQLQTAGTIIQFIFYFSLLSLFIPNPKNYNDNSSGVLTILELAERIAKKPDLKQRVKFILFDNEEWGLLGSMMQQKKWRKRNPLLNNTRLITVDCVGRGNFPVIIKLKKNSETGEQLAKLLSRKITPRVKRLPYYPFSDNFSFSHSESINISMMDKTFLPGGYYIKNIHSPSDRKIDLTNIKTIADSLEAFITSLSGRDKNEETYIDIK